MMLLYLQTTLLISKITRWKINGSKTGRGDEQNNEKYIFATKRMFTKDFLLDINNYFLYDNASCAFLVPHKRIKL